MGLLLIKILLGIVLLSAFVTFVGGLFLLSVMIYILIWQEEVSRPIVYFVADVTLISFVFFLIMLAVNDLSD